MVNILSAQGRCHAYQVSDYLCITPPLQYLDRGWPPLQALYFHLVFRQKLLKSI